MSALTIVKAEPLRATWNLGGPDFRTSRALVQAALVALTETEVSVHGEVSLLSADELRSLLAAMDGAWEADLDKQRERLEDYDS